MSSGENHRYALSFTSGALLSREAAIAAPIYLETRDWDAVRKRLQDENLLQARTAASAARTSRELLNRLKMLTDEEAALLAEATSTERDQLMWVATCRYYDFIADFAQQVVRERFLLMTPSLTYEQFDGFVRERMVWHPELGEIKASTLNELRKTLFRMLREVGVLVDGEIVPVLLSQRVEDVLTEDDKRVFPSREEAG